jgi:hypothetical protein
VAVDPRAVLAALALLVAGCGSAPPAAPPAPPPTAAPDPVAVCTTQLTYWAGEELRGAPDSGFDYQEMGLTHAQSDALDTLVAEARAQPARPPDWVPARARALCAAIPPETPSTGAGWP